MRRPQLDIQLKTPDQIEKMRAAGLVVAEALRRMREAVAPGVSTAELDAIAESTIRAAGATPSFKGYHGFPASICSSVNEQVVHAIPAPTQVLRDGDVISVDCGAVLHGWHGDAAITVGVGEVEPALLTMAAVAEDAMWAGIAAAARSVAGGRGRLTDISHAIEAAVRKGGRYGIVDGYGGHGIGTEMHQDPHVLNHGRPGRGPRLVPGMALAIEPMITLGSPRTVELADGWTVVTRDGSRAVHVEHTMALLPDGVWVLTAPDGGRERLGDLVTARQPAVTA
ncbi:type I methionyl aminopeptidase [Salinispora arenicola]|uniref:Methionine aminopeptidase n=2 Tax=Salinispora arenicola TaxID=168697 RepID=A0A542XMH5_SALAC|nr:type I methionyl aminopeptidase [Salinispora arenicola]MCN0153127.1 type I methionyl aminopeptidase [Salinispora arenicola]MCN0179733.1 type I methionyl aminopeptidase [Salinispora arenicola]TQL37047.1 methionyl aminopeptidase [Salinispora arenicola]GIM81976.1 methionine aminopeptidase [Salinispora arenicola]